VIEQRVPDPQKGQNALARSRHNNYFTLPVLFIMISSHYAGTFGHPWNWLVLLVISMVGVGIRHWFNIRHLEKHSRLVLPLSLLVLAALIFALRPEPRPDIDDKIAFPSTAAIMPVLQARCVTCHAAKPDHPGFAAAPLGVQLDRTEAVDLQASIIFDAVIIKQSMPLANVTHMSDEERDLIARWYAGQMRSKN
ncbi:MAG: urate hydroxylase PuuD, partial [Xanthomonadales bacterium]